jgi:preprotein translocase subunit YajC
MFGFIFFSLGFLFIILSQNNKKEKEKEKEQYNLKIINANEKTISNNHYG